MYDDRLSGVISEEFYVRKRAEFEQRLEEIEGELDKDAKATSGRGEDIKPTLEMIDKVGYYFKTGGYYVQKALAKMIFEKVTVKGRILKFRYALPFSHFVDKNTRQVTVSEDKSVQSQ